MCVTLGIDTSTSRLSVATVRDGEAIAERAVGPGDGGRPRHAQRLLVAVEEVVEQVGGWDRIVGVAVGVGPGTFTGLRIGVATSRALAQGRGLTLTGVSSLAALARGSEGKAASTLAVLDAKRKEAFWALYSPTGAAEWEPAVGPPEELTDCIVALPDPPLAVGDGALRFRAQLTASGATVPPDGDARHHVHARHVCELAANLPAGPPEAIHPHYLRRPDAELWRERDPRQRAYD